MEQNSTTGKDRGYREAAVGSFAGAVIGVLSARFLAALLVGLGGLAGLELRSLSDTLLLLLPPLGAVTACATALHLAGRASAASSALFILLSPLASWLFWEAQQLGSAELWSLRVIPVVLLTLLAPLAHALARASSRRGGEAQLESLVTGQR